MSNLLEQASLVMIPSGYKEDVVYSEIPLDGGGDLQFTRASNGTRVNSAGNVQVVPWNFMQQSNAFSTSPWSKANTTLTSGQTDPNGGSNAWKVEFASGGNAYLGQFGIGQIGVVTISAYFRADSTTTIGFNDGSAFANSITIGTTWQRYEFSYTVTAGQCNMQIDNYFGVSPSGQAKTFYIYGAQLNIGSTAQPYFPTTDRLNVPRLTYQNGGGGCPSLLLEKQSTNLVYPSEDFSPWNLFNSATISTNTTISPDGTQNADTLNFASSAISQVFSNQGDGTNTAHTVSIYAKSSSGKKFRIKIANSTTGGDEFSSNLTTTNDWQRFDFTFTCPVTHIAICNESSGGTGTIQIWGAQLEASNYVTSYINTTSSSATRVADACYKTGISSLIGQTEGVLFWDGIATQGNYNQLIFIKDSSANQFIGLTVASGIIYGEIYNSGYVQLFSIAIASNESRFKLALAYKTNDFAMYVNGTQVATASTGTTPTSFDDFYLGNTNNLRDWNCEVKQAILFPTRLTNAELASLTTI